MVDECCDEYVENDWYWLVIVCGQYEGKQLGFVVDFSEGDGVGGDQEGLRYEWGFVGCCCVCE